MSGLEGKERVTCVHCLAVNVQMPMLLMSGLTEHLLLELLLQWNKQLQNSIEYIEKLDDVKRSVRTLTIAAKDGQEKCGYVKNNGVNNIPDLFSVGTEYRK
eukprot:187160-Ditylum_brightwellii.AAC.1